MINSLQCICTKAVQCIGNTLVIIGTRLISCGHINDMTPATMQNCSAGSVQVSSDPRSSQGLHFLPKTRGWHQKWAFWHCFIRHNQSAKGPDVLPLLKWPPRCDHRDVHGNCSHTSETRCFSREKMGQCLTLLWSDQILKDEEMPEAMYTVLVQYLCSNPNMASLFHPTALGFIQPPSIKMYGFLLSIRQLN